MPRSRPFCRAPLASLLLVPLLALAGCSGSEAAGPAGAGSEESAPEPEGGVRAREAAKVIVAELVEREMRRTLETTTVLESEHEVALVPRAAGIVVEVLAEEGDTVAAGQVLARMDDRAEALALRDAEIALEEAHQALETGEVGVAEAENRIATAQVNLAQAERDLERDEKLLAGAGSAVGSVSLKAVEATRLLRDQAAQEFASGELAARRAALELNAARTAVTRAELARDQADLSLRFLRLTAPFDGVIASRSIRVGDLAAGTEPAFVLTDASSLRAVFNRPQRELELFQRGGDAPLELTARTEAAPGQVFHGRVLRVSPTVDSSSGNFRVTARIDPTPESADDASAVRLRPGMLLRVEIVIERRMQALSAPKRALVREGEQAYVFAVEQGRARKVAVAEGFTDADHVELTGLDEFPLGPGTELVIVGARELSDGDAIEAQRLNAPATELGEAAAAAPEAEAAETAATDPSGADDAR